jgi:hypothetical protein
MFQRKRPGLFVMPTSEENLAEKINDPMDPTHLWAPFPLALGFLACAEGLPRIVLDAKYPKLSPLAGKYYAECVTSLLLSD